jgi:hypothetical protein
VDKPSVPALTWPSFLEFRHCGQYLTGARVDTPSVMIHHIF